MIRYAEISNCLRGTKQPFVHKKLDVEFGKDCFVPRKDDTWVRKGYEVRFLTTHLHRVQKPVKVFCRDGCSERDTIIFVGGDKN